MSSSPALSLMCCYAHEDGALREQFEKHLAMLKRLGWVASWSDRDISAGTEWQRALDHHLRTADLLLLFVSADFLHSDYCYRAQMQEALRRHKAGEARVIPILLRPVEWEQTPLGALQALPRDGRPITSWRDQDEAFEHIAQEIRVVVERLRQPVVIVSCLPHQPFSEHLAYDLTAHGIPIWEAETTQGPAVLKEHIRGASAVVVITSPGAEHARVLKEATHLSEMYQRPVIGVWVADEAQDERPDASPQPSHRHEWIVTESGQEQSALQELRASLQRSRFQSPQLSPQETPALNREPRNPYKGLRAFTTDDVGDFFGRTALVDSLVATVKTTLSLEKKGQQPARLLALVGASGSGKSSIVQAGLLPALQAGKATQSDMWSYLNGITPKTHPLDELALALFDVFPEKSVKMLREDLGDDCTRGLHFYATALARREGSKRVMLVVDQFEEVFTLTENEQERQQFLDLLVTACTKRDGPLIVALTLRADFYDRLMQYPALYQLVAGHLTPMLPMTLSDLRAVITQPARLPDVQLTFEGNLVGDLLFDVQGQIGALPLLQFTLEQLFERREGYVLMEHAYQEIGGIRGALTKHAEETYLVLPSQKHREIARVLFLRLLDPGTTEQETTRRRAALTEFVFADGGQTRLMQETRDIFVKARLLMATANGRTGTTTVEVSHEALIREWPRLVNWLHEARDDIHLLQSISRDAATWEQNKHSRDRLYQGTILKEAQAWAKRNTVSRQEQEFLKASVTRQFLSLLVVIGVLLLVVTSSGIAGWLYINRPPIHGHVTTTDEYAIGSLRWAIGNAAAGETITFAPNLAGQTIVLKYADIHIFQPNLTIRGPATGHLTIRGIGASFINDTSAATTIWNITFQGSKAKGQSSLIRNEGKLTLEMCTISGNTASHSSPVPGLATSEGGGIYNSGTLTLTNSPVSNNSASGYSTGPGPGYGEGGGIYNSGTLTLTNSPVSNNSASGTDPGPGYGNGFGGGIYNSGTLTLTNSLVSGNGAGFGGGIENTRTLTLTNSLVSNNSASGTGGGIDNFGTDSSTPHATLVFCTIVNNSATDRKGIDINGTIGHYIYLKASIVGGNSTQAMPIVGTITSGGYNIIQHLSSVRFVGKPQSTDRSVDDLSHMLRPFPVSPNKNDPTLTYQLIPSTNNPAYNAVPKDACTDATGHRVLTDQRGMQRPGKKKLTCDSGAYESQASP